MKTEFKNIDFGTVQWQAAVVLREEILRKPFGLQFTKEELQEEKTHIKIVGLLDNEIVATAVLVPEKTAIKMQRVVVKDTLRNLQVGSKMMVFCEAVGKKEGFKTMYCHARDSAVNFYLNNGYKGVGGYFNEDGIPHLKMTKELS